jgi:hypothetical protein
VVVVPAVTRKGAQRSMKQVFVDAALKDCYVTRVEEQEFLLHLDKEITAIGKACHPSPRLLPLERQELAGIMGKSLCSNDQP